MKSPLHFLKIIDSFNNLNLKIILRIIYLLIFLSFGAIISALISLNYEIKIGNEEKNVKFLTYQKELYGKLLFDYSSLRSHYIQFRENILNTGLIYNELDARGLIVNSNNEKYVMNYNHHLIYWKDLSSLNELNEQFILNLLLVINQKNILINKDLKLKDDFEHNKKLIQDEINQYWQKYLTEFIKKPLLNDDLKIIKEVIIKSKRLKEKIKDFNYFIFNPQRLDLRYYQTNKSLKRISECNNHVSLNENNCILQFSKIVVIRKWVHEIFEILAENGSLIENEYEKYMEINDRLIKISKDNMSKYTSLTSLIFGITFLIQLFVFLIIQFGEVFYERRRQ